MPGNTYFSRENQHLLLGPACHRSFKQPLCFAHCDQFSVKTCHVWRPLALKSLFCFSRTAAFQAHVQIHLSASFRLRPIRSIMPNAWKYTFFSRKTTFFARASLPPKLQKAQQRSNERITPTFRQTCAFQVGWRGPEGITITNP